VEWIILIIWLSIINGGLGGQYVLNWMANQPKYTGGDKIDISPGVMTWWREISKLLWVVVAVVIELIRGKKAKYLWPGFLSLTTIIVCAFTGVIENIGFFYLPRNYSPHIFAPYVNVYLAFLPFFGKLMFNAPIRKEHWIGIMLVIAGLATPHLPYLLGFANQNSDALDINAIIWIVIINGCLLSQQVLNNKTVQTALPGVGPNALVLWREIWKMIFISSAILIIPIIGNMMNANMPKSVKASKFETRVLFKVDESKKEYLLNYYAKSDNKYILKSDVSENEEAKIKEIVKSTGYHQFFSLFDGSIIPNNWIPILFVIAAGLTGYIYSFGFFKLSKFAAHFWVPYTNVWLALLPFIMFLFGKEVTGYQIAGAVVVTAGLMIGVMDHRKNKVVEIEKKRALDK
jgi:drug/metabolite transporter (DMT)-like permease